jgi:integrase/recombinase XerC
MILTGALSQPVRDNLAHMRLRALSDTYVTARRQILGRMERRLSLPALRLSESDLDDYQRSWLPPDPASRRVELSHICGFYRWALRGRLIKTDPTLLIVYPKKARRLPRPISEEDLDVAILNAPARIRPWLILAAYAGLRAAEIAGLDRSDVLDSQSPPVLLVHGKGSKDRIVPMNATVRHALKVHGLPGRGAVFQRADGIPGPNTASNLDHTANVYLRSVGVPATLHQLRHRFATRIYRECHDLLLVGALLGHSDPSTTAGYAAYAREDATMVVLILDAERQLRPA